MTTLNSYGASLDSGGTPNGPGSLFSTSNFLRAINDSGTSLARYQVEWYSIERAVQTTSSTSVGSAGSATITLASVPANFTVGTAVLIDTGSSQETVTITVQSGSTITATFAYTHSGTYPVAVIPQAGDTPTSSGSPARVQAYDWTIFDDFVTTCTTHGLFIDFVLQNAPVWHQDNLANDNSKNVPTAVDAATFATDVMNRAATKGASIYTFEVANEGFNTGNLTSGNAASMFNQMYTLLSAVRTAVKAVSTTPLIGAPAELNKTTANISLWTAGFFNAGCHTLVDYVNFHFYPGGAPDNPSAGNSGFQQWIASWQSAMATAGSYLPIWVTELGWTMSVVGDTNYNSYITAIVNDAVASHGVAAIFLYDLDSIVPALHFNDSQTNQTYKTWKNFIATIPTFTSSTKLTVYLSSAAAATIVTAGNLYSLAGSPATTSNTTLLGTAQSWGEIYAQGTTGAWAAAPTQAGIPPSGHGFLWDVTTLELQDLLTGPYTVTLRLSTAGVGAVTITADLHAVLYKYTGSTYTTQIADCVLTAQSISTVFANYTLTFTVSGNTSFAIGDKLYMHLPTRIVTNTGASTQTIRLGGLSTDTVGKTGSTNAQMVTPGFLPTPIPVPPSGPAGNTLGRGILAQIRLGDGLATQMRPLTNAMGLSYIISSSQNAQSCSLTYSIQAPNTAPMLLYYLIAPGGAFAINGDATIIAPDAVVHTPRPVTARTLIAEPLLQGYKSMSWDYSVLQLSEYSQILSYYDPQNPVVLLTYPDETGTWQQCNAVMHPPQYGSQKTLFYYDVVLTFTRLT